MYETNERTNERWGRECEKGTAGAGERDTLEQRKRPIGYAVASSELAKCPYIVYQLGARNYPLFAASAMS